ncbi:MAG: T9SS C-terminal target domain-containing protein, partial [Cryomorphaceae bacterium]
KLKKVPLYTSVDEKDAVALQVFPNPANDRVTFRCSTCTVRSTILIFDVSGRIIRSFDLGDNYEGQVLWDTRHERSGMYFYQLWQNNQKVSAGKVVVQH